MSPLRLLAAAGIASLAAACASGPATHVTLLDGEPGHPVGSVAVFDAKSEVERGVLDRANTTALAGSGSVKAKPATNTYGDLTAALPEEAKGYTLYFLEGTSNVAPESDAEYARMLVEVAKRPGAEVQITGHTDTVGRGEDNDALSIRRAIDIRTALILKGLDPAITRATGRGERELLVPTPDNTPEPKNRRVQVTVR